jgi:uncharacterized repeat protein (TIGR01451 family)
MRLILAICFALALGLPAKAQTLTPAGTPIRNQASAGFVGPNGDPGVVYSGVAETTVLAVHGLQIKPDAGNAPSSITSNFSLAPDPRNDRITTLGGTVGFAYTITNTGNGPDSYSLSVIQSNSDDFDLSNLQIIIDSNENGLLDGNEPALVGSLNLNAGAHTGLILVGRAPIATTGSGNASASLDLIGSSSLDATNPGNLENNNIARVSISTDANLSLNKEARLLSDGRIKYHLFGSNVGSRAARSSLSGVILDGTLYFGILLSDDLPANTKLDLLELPNGSAGGAGAAKVIYKIGFGTWSNTPSSNASSVGLFIPDKNPTTGSPTTDTLNISGGYELNFHLRTDPGLRAGSLIANTAVIQYRDSTNRERETTSNTTLTGTPTKGSSMIGPQSQPTGLASGTYRFTDPSTAKTWTINRSLTGSNQSDQQNIESSGGSNVISFVNTVQNTGNARDTLSVQFDPNHVSSVLPVGSSVQLYSPDGITPLTNGLTLEPGEMGDLIVRVTLPTTSGVTNATAVIRTVSGNDPTRTDITRNIIGDLPQPEVLIGPLGQPDAIEYPAPSDQQSLEPFEAASARFAHTVRNNGNIKDVINLSLDTPLPSGFTARWLMPNGTPLTDSDNDGLVDTGTMAAKTNLDLILEITPAPGTSGNNGGPGWEFVAKATSSTDRSVTNRTLDLIVRIRAAGEIWTIKKTVSTQAGANQLLAPESKVIYSLEVANNGYTPQHQVLVSDTLNQWLEAPTQITDLSLRASDGTQVLLSAHFDAQSRKLEWLIPEFPANTSISLTFHSSVRKDTPDATVIPNIARVNSQDIPREFVSNLVSINVLTPVLKLTKVALEGSVGIGGVVGFEIEARNNSDSASLSKVSITDFMPVGLVYRNGSSRLNNTSIGDPEITIENGAQTLRWNIGELPAGTGSKIRFAAVATTALPNEVVNQATSRAIAANGAIIVESNVARASIKRAAGIFSRSSTVIGRVYFDTDGNKRFDPDRDEVMPNARIYLSNGRYAITDQNGLYSLPDLSPGRYAMRLDPLTVPFLAARIPEDQCAPGTRPLLLEGDGIISKDFLLLPPAASATKVRSTFLQLGTIKLEKRLLQGGAGYAVEMILNVDRNIANVSLYDPLPGNSGGDSGPSERQNPILERIDATGKVLETMALSIETDQGFNLGSLSAGTYRLRYALLTDLDPNQAVTDPDLTWNEVQK